MRLGWEMNGTFMPWSGLDTRQYIDCYRHAALAIRETAPNVLFDNSRAGNVYRELWGA